jgi:hypothetical protein
LEPSGGQILSANSFPAAPHFPAQYGYTPGYSPGFHYAEAMFAMDPASGRPMFVHPVQPYPQPHMLPPPNDMHPYGIPMQPMAQPALYADGGQIQFALPRQNRRVEIRRPAGQLGEEPRLKETSNSSTLRHDIEPFMPGMANTRYHQEAQAGASGQGDAQPFAYQGTQYFIPPQFAYGQFVDHAHMYEGFVEGHPYYG